MFKKWLALGIISLFTFASVSPMVFGFEYKTFDKDEILKKLDFICSDRYVSSKLDQYKELFQRDGSDTAEPEEAAIPIDSPRITSGGPMDSPWPMYCHNLHHTSRSPYSTADNPGIEKWRFNTNHGWVEGGIAIGDDGTIYFGSFDTYIYALYPNGTFKWKYDTGDWVQGTPAIAEDGTIYVGSYDDYLYAINSNGTLKWKLDLGSEIIPSPAIAEDGAMLCRKWE